MDPLATESKWSGNCAQVTAGSLHWHLQWHLWRVSAVGGGQSFWAGKYFGQNLKKKKESLAFSESFKSFVFGVYLSFMLIYIYIYIL